MRMSTRMRLAVMRAMFEVECFFETTKSVLLLVAIIGSATVFQV